MPARWRRRTCATASTRSCHSLILAVAVPVGPAAQADPVVAPEALVDVTAVLVDVTAVLVDVTAVLAAPGAQVADRLPSRSPRRRSA